MNEFALSDRDAKAQYLVSQCITRYAQRRFLIQQQSTQKELNIKTVNDADHDTCIIMIHDLLKTTTTHHSADAENLIWKSPNIFVIGALSINCTLSIIIDVF